MSIGQIIDGVATAMMTDSSGEVLEIKGLDISDFEEGRAHLNWEHRAADESEIPASEAVGKVIFAKKIYKKDDCTGEREKLFWERLETPFVYVVCRLFDAAGHKAAQNIAAIIRDAHANNDSISIGFSIEGSTVKRENNRLISTMARRLAITLRPCLKTATMGLLSDPEAPKGFDKTPAKADIASLIPEVKDTKKNHDPLMHRLGGTEMVYGPEMMKAMSAGSYNAAPGSLTSGASLQVEDRTLKAQVMAAYRDWDKSTPFKKFLKSRLPEVSDEFLDHFENIVDKHLYRIKKAAENIVNLQKAGKTPKVAKSKAPKKVKEEEAPAKAAPPPLTVHGIPVPQSTKYNKDDGPFFDMDEGALHTNRGVFHLNTVERPHPHHAAKGITPELSMRAFGEALAQNRPAHQRAMKNWIPLNEQFRRGEVNPDILSHGIFFALNSPGNPVIQQEHSFSHQIDRLKEAGLGSVQTPEQWEKVGRLWLAGNWSPGQKGHLPEHSKEYFENLVRDLRPGQHIRGLVTKEGNYVAFPKPQQTYGYFHGYLKDTHQKLLNLLQKEKPGDARAASEFMVDNIKGVAPKLARYTLGMIGGGNMFVPDTHKMRHSFGLLPDAPGGATGSSPDNETFHHIRDVLTGHKNSNKILSDIDEYYTKNHPAVQAVMNDPDIGSYFQKHPDQVTFPAFWWHWTSVPTHENLIGTPNGNHANSAVDHTPFWDAIAPFRKNEEQQTPEYDPTLPAKTAEQHLRWVEQYGGMPALALYMEHLVPRLQANWALKAKTRL